MKADANGIFRGLDDPMVKMTADERKGPLFADAARDLARHDLTSPENRFFVSNVPSPDPSRSPVRSKSYLGHERFISMQDKEVAMASTINSQQ